MAEKDFEMHATIDDMIEAIKQIDKDGVLHAKYFDAIEQLAECLRTGDLVIVTKSDMEHYERLEGEAYRKQ